MKRLLFLVTAAICSASISSAQTVTCSVTGATAKQSTQYAALLASINTERAAQGLAPYSGFPTHCAATMLSVFNSWVSAQTAKDAAKVAAAAEAKGDEVAPTDQCAVAGLGAGCTKAQVACWVLTGNTACN